MAIHQDPATTSAASSRERTLGAGRREAAAAPHGGQYLTLRIAGELYAVGVLETSEVLEYRPPTPVPRAPAWVAGMLNLRGKAIPVMDLAAKFGAGGQEPGSSTCIVVLDLVIDEEVSQVGLIADEMPVVVQLGPEQILEPPLFGTRIHVRYLRGMARLEGGLMLLLDAAGALTAEEAALLSRLDSAAPDARDPQAVEVARDAAAGEPDAASEADPIDGGPGASER
jgi:purine-binding chemotaxis protein CheW